MSERNWGIIVGVVTMFVTILAALLAGVSEETAFMRGLIGAGVGAFIGVGFNYLGSAAGAASGSQYKGTRLDVILNELAPPEPSNTSEKAPEFHPLDIVRMARVVQEEAKNGPS